jgi:hypothetical protein
MSACDDAKPHIVLEDSDLALIQDDATGEYILNG